MKKKTKLKFSDQDLYVNVAGGVKFTESAIDAALAVALYSARTDIPLSDGTVVLGELSLAGEIRPVPRLKQRIKTARDLGFTQIAAPENEDDAVKVSGVSELVKAVFGK